MYLVDFSEEMIKFAKQNAKKGKVNAEFIVSKAEKLPFSNNFFDAGICVALLQCIPGEKKREKVAKELFRVLKPGAKAQILVWNKNSKRFRNSPRERSVKWRDKGERYYFLYNEKEISNLFKRIGFLILSSKADKNITLVVEKP